MLLSYQETNFSLRILLESFSHDFTLGCLTCVRYRLHFDSGVVFIQASI